MSFVTDSLPIGSLQVGNGTVDNATPSKLDGARSDKIYFGVEIHNISGSALFIDVNDTPTPGASFKLGVGRSCEIPVDNPLALNLLAFGADVSYSWRAI